MKTDKLIGKGLKFLTLLIILTWYVHADPIVADHIAVSEFNQYVDDPDFQAAIVAAKNSLHIVYGHTSHGSQITNGMTGLNTFMNNLEDSDENPLYTHNLFAWNNGGSNGALDIHDRGLPLDVGYGGWDTATREYLDLPSNSNVNIVLWSWCGQVDTVNIQTHYLDNMEDLETEYPDVTFIYMTGHLEGRETGDPWFANNIAIRDWVTSSEDRVFFDFVDIEKYDPDQLVNYADYSADDACNYDSNGDGSRDSNWATEWQDSHTQNVDWYSVSCAHSVSLNCNQKAKAFWWLMATMAGWSSDGTEVVCGDGTCHLSEDCSTCSDDCGACPSCGDEECNGDETCDTCSDDCGACPSCGDEECNGDETCDTCPDDCGVCPPSCGDSECNGDETCSTCSDDCGACPPVCGDEECNGDETCETCELDCGDCPAYCGDDNCDNTEDCSICEDDCGVCPFCGDDNCDFDEDCLTCEDDCGACPAYCGDSSCDINEDCDSCDTDCGACNYCGDDTCDDDEDCLECAADCGTCQNEEGCPETKPENMLICEDFEDNSWSDSFDSTFNPDNVNLVTSYAYDGNYAAEMYGGYLGAAFDYNIDIEEGDELYIKYYQYFPESVWNWDEISETGLKQFRAQPDDGWPLLMFKPGSETADMRTHCYFSDGGIDPEPTSYQQLSYISKDTWHDIEIMVRYNNSHGGFAWYVDDVLIAGDESWSYNTWPPGYDGTLTNIRLGGGNGFEDAGTYYVDNIEIWNKIPEENIILPPNCGNGTCDEDETCSTCDTDCGVCSYCGDGLCDEALENCTICALDCEACPPDCAHDAEKAICDGVVDEDEIFSYIMVWRAGDASLSALMEAIALWKG